MACRNNSSTIRGALDSVLSEAESTALNVEILVIDKQSTDETLEILGGYHNIKVIQQTGNGLANARNEAISHVTAAVVGFCDADDTWASGSLNSRMQILHESNGLMHQAMEDTRYWFQDLLLLHQSPEMVQEVLFAH